MALAEIAKLPPRPRTIDKEFHRNTMDPIEYAAQIAASEAPRRPIIDVVTGRPFNEPSLLLSLERHDASMQLFFEGLRSHYFECIASGRLDAWKKAGHAIIDLCGSMSEAEIVKRTTLQ